MLIQRTAKTQRGEVGVHTGPLGSDRVTCVLWEDEKKPAPRWHRRDKRTLIWSGVIQLVMRKGAGHSHRMSQLPMLNCMGSILFGPYFSA